MVGTYRKFTWIFVKIIILLISLIGLSLSVIPIKESAYATGSSCIVMEQKSRTVLKGDNISARLPIASTTKIMTALIVLENAKLDDCVTITKESVGVEGSSIYLKVDQKFTVRELLYGMLLRSGNDASIALSIHTAKSVNAFVDLMNKKCEELGLKNTNFCNPHGLHDDKHYSSAYDLAYITCIAMDNPTFREIICTKKIDIGSTETNNYQTLYNKNKFLHKYDGGNGVKTGFTKKSGRCLVASATKNEITMVSVAINIPDTYGTCTNLIDYGFRSYKN